MTEQRRASGTLGENLAADYLKRQGYVILERNFANELGELDIIARDKDYLCIIEVKTRLSDAYGSPLEAITRHKQKKIIKVAQSYLKFKQMSNCQARFDVVAVMFNEGPDYEIGPDGFGVGHLGGDRYYFRLRGPALDASDAAPA